MCRGGNHPLRGCLVGRRCRGRSCACHEWKERQLQGVFSECMFSPICTPLPFVADIY